VAGESYGGARFPPMLRIGRAHAAAVARLVRDARDGTGRRTGEAPVPRNDSGNGRRM